MALPAVDQTEVGLKYRTALGMFADIVVRWQAWLYACQIRHNARYNIQSWTGPCITPSPCINVTFPPSTTENIEVSCTLHAVNNTS